MSQIVTSARRRRAYDTAAYDQHAGRLYARHAAQQTAFAAAGFLQKVAAFLRRHPARYFGHGHQQRQRAVGPFDGLIGTAYGAAVDHRMGQGFAAGEVEVGKDQLVAAHEFVFGRNRFLDFHDHFRTSVHFLDRGEYFGAHRGIGIVRKSAVCTGRSLHIDFVAPPGQFPDAGRSQSNAVFVVLDLFGDTDNHGC